MVGGPRDQGFLKTDVLASLLAGDPLVPPDLLQFGEELGIRSGAAGRGEGRVHQWRE